MRPGAKPSGRPPRTPANRAMPPELTNRQISAEVRARMAEEEVQAQAGRMRLEEYERADGTDMGE